MTASQRGVDTDRVLEIVQRVLELEDGGEDVSIPQLCGADATLADRVREILGQRSTLSAWASSPSGPTPLAGRVLGERYLIEEQIGAGAMGAVFSAQDLELKRSVALKILHPHLFASADATARFLREAEVLATIRHPCVVAVYDRGRTEDGLHFLVMELLRGVPMSRLLDEVESRVAGGGWEAVRDTEWLSEWADAGALTEHSWVRLAARWTADLAAGLSAAHAAGIYHRDVKPSNVFVGERGVCLVDFGIAARADDVTLTHGDSTVGTPRYMAPEQASGETAPHTALDVYSLSATLYHLLAARGPYPGGVSQVLAALQREEPVPVGRLHPGLPVDLQAIVECGMAREAAKRYSSAADMEADLRAFLEHRPISARRAGVVARTLRRARRSRAAQFGVAVLVVAVVSVGVPAWVRDRAAARHAAFLDEWAQLPPALTLGLRPVIDDTEDRGAARRRLDAAVEYAPDHVATRCLRAAFLLDHGDAVGAAEDMAEVAGLVPGPVAAILAERYRAAASGGGRDALDTTGLPDPQSPGERLLVGFHAMRALDYEAAAPLLSADGNSLAARDLGLIVRLALGLQGGDSELLQQLDDEALQIEGAYGCKTARTRYVVGGSLAALGRYDEALVPLGESVALAPRSFPTLQNLGVAYRNTGQPALAEELFERAVAVRPGAAKSLGELAMARADQGRFDEAQEAADQISQDGPASWRRPEALAYLEHARALRRLSDGDSDGAAEAARRSCAYYEETLDAVGALAPRLAPMFRMNIEMCRAVISGDNGALCAALLEHLSGQPHQPIHLDNLVQKLPNSFDASQMESLRTFLRRLATDASQRAITQRETAR